MSKVWFATKSNGEVIELTEIEALTHFEHNNIAQRMRLQFIGTSDGSKWEAGRKEVSALVRSKREEDYPDYFKLNKEEKNLADFDIQSRFAKDIRVITDKAYADEMAQAKTNGVEQPDKSLRILTKKDGGDATGQARNQILNSM